MFRVKLTRVRPRATRRRRFALRPAGTIRLLGDRSPLLCLNPVDGNGGLTAFMTPEGGLAPYDATAFRLLDFDDPSEALEADWLSGSITRGFHGSIYGRELLVFPLAAHESASDHRLASLGTLARRILPVLEVVR